MPNERYLLKIIGGPNQGAEVALGDGEIIIGSSPECDLILSDTLVSAKHVKVVVSGDTVSFLPLELPVYLNGEEVPKELQKLDFFKFVSLGTTHFVIGPMGGEWPSLTAADIPVLKKKEVPAPGGGVEGPGAEGAKVATGAGEELPKETKPFYKRSLYVYSAAGGLLFLMLVAFMVPILLIKPPTITKEQAKPADIAADMRELLKSEGYADKVTITPNKGMFIIQGWVNSNQQKDAIINLLSDYANITDIRVYSQEQVGQAIRDILATKGLPLAVESLGPGKVRISGYAGDTSTWEAIRDELKRDVVGIKYIEESVLTEEKIVQIIQQALKQFEIGDKISLIPQNGFLLAKGMLTRKDIPILKDAMEHIQKKIGFPIPIKNQVLVSESEKVYLDTKIESIIIGDGNNAIITTQGGQKLFKGGILPGGYIIEDIGRKGIVLRKNGQTITLTIGDFEKNVQ